jgi:hypothetical protein
VVDGDYLPHLATVQPSVAYLAPKIVAYSPDAQVIGVHILAPPPAEYYPLSHISQPSFAVVAPVIVAYYPGEHVIEMQVVFEPPLE